MAHFPPSVFARIADVIQLALSGIPFNLKLGQFIVVLQRGLGGDLLDLGFVFFDLGIKFIKSWLSALLISVFFISFDSRHICLLGSWAHNRHARKMRCDRGNYTSNLASVPPGLHLSFARIAALSDGVGPRSGRSPNGGGFVALEQF